MAAGTDSLILVRMSSDYPRPWGSQGFSERHSAIRSGVRPFESGRARPGTLAKFFQFFRLFLLGKRRGSCIVGCLIGLTLPHPSRNMMAVRARIHRVVHRPLMRRLAGLGVFLLAGFVAAPSARADCGDYVIVGGMSGATASHHRMPAPAADHAAQDADQSPRRLPCSGPGCSRAPRARLDASLRPRPPSPGVGIPLADVRPARPLDRSRCRAGNPVSTCSARPRHLPPSPRLTFPFVLCVLATAPARANAAPSAGPREPVSLAKRHTPTRNV